MNKKQIVGAIIAAGLFIVIGVSSVFSNAISKNMLAKTAAAEVEQILSGGAALSLPYEPYIGVVSVYGVIEPQADTGIFDIPQGYQHLAMLEYVDEMMQDENNQGILLDVDSGGGTTYESEEFYEKILQYKETTGRPVWTYMNHTGASGAYFIAAASDRIYANQNTLTGSIGVIISGLDMSGLYEKLGINAYSVTSGDYKDMSSPTEEQLTVYQDIVDESYVRFVNAVAEGRAMSAEDVKTLADGRIYSAEQAKENGLIDEISSYEEMQAAMQEELGNATFYQPTHETSMFASLFSKVKSAAPKSEAQVLTELAEKYGSGVPMYYAEQLR